MSRMWAVLTTGGRVVARNVVATEEAGVRVQYDMRGKVVIPLMRALAEYEDVTLAGEIVDAVDRLKPVLLARIDAEREAARGATMTTGIGQSYAYAEKAREVADYRAIAVDVLAALTQPRRIARFPFAMAEAEVGGDTLAAVVERFEAGIAASRQRIAAIEAAATKAKRLVRAASSAVDMRAAAMVAWPKA